MSGVIPDTVRAERGPVVPEEVRGLARRIGQMAERCTPAFAELARAHEAVATLFGQRVVDQLTRPTLELHDNVAVAAGLADELTKRFNEYARDTDAGVVAVIGDVPLPVVGIGPISRRFRIDLHDAQKRIVIAEGQRDEAVAALRKAEQRIRQYHRRSGSPLPEWFGDVERVLAADDERRGMWSGPPYTSPVR